MLPYRLVHLQKLPVVSYSAALMELYIAQKNKKKINILQLEPTYNSSFPKSNYSSFAVTLGVIDSCKDPERLFC